MSDLYSPCSSPVQNTEVGSLSLLQSIFLTKESTGVSCIADGFFTIWIIREALRMKGEFQSWPWECFWDLVVLLSQHSDWCIKILNDVWMLWVSALGRRFVFSFFFKCKHFQMGKAEKKSLKSLFFLEESFGNMGRKIPALWGRGLDVDTTDC